MRSMGGHAVVGFVFVFACTLAPSLVYLFSGPRRGVALTVDVHVSVLQHTDTMSSRPRVIPPPRAQPCVVLRHACVALSSRVPLRRDRFAALQRQRTLCSQPACHCVQISCHCGAAASTHTVFAARVPLCPDLVSLRRCSANVHCVRSRRWMCRLFPIRASASSTERLCCPVARHAARLALQRDELQQPASIGGGGDNAAPMEVPAAPSATSLQCQQTSDRVSVQRCSRICSSIARGVERARSCSRAAARGVEEAQECSCSCYTCQ